MPGKTAGTSMREPWLSFLREVDAALDQPVELHCIGGFALSVLTDWPRPTGDIDLIKSLPTSAEREVLEIAGQQSALADKYKINIQRVTVTDAPCDYADRLIDVTPVGFERLTVRVLEPHDLALTKLDRNSPRDREDVRFMAEKGLLQRAVLSERYEEELRPYLLNERRASLTLELWLDDFFDG